MIKDYIQKTKCGLIVKAPHMYITIKEQRGGYYDQVIHAIACGLKNLKEKEIRRVAAYEMSRVIPKGATLIPIPSSKNDIKPNLLLAQSIANIIDGKVINALVRETNSNQSGWNMRRAGLPGPNPESIIHHLVKAVPENSILIDNVATTGATLDSAAKACNTSVIAVVWAMGKLRLLRKKEDILRSSI